MNWYECEFRDFITLQRGFDLPKLKMKEGEIPVLGSNCIIGYHNEPRVHPPGVITGRSGTLGVVQYVDEPYWPHNTALWVKDFKGNDPRFVYYKLKTLNLEMFSSGASIPTLNRNNLDNLIVSIPEVEQQKRIASILSAYDDLIENNLRRIKLLEESARLLYKEWFVRLRFPGYEHTRIIEGVPEGWEIVKFGEICEAIGGGTPSTSNREYWEGGEITWVIPSDVTKNDCLILLDSEKKITEQGLKNSSAKLVPPNTILMTSRASVGFFALIDKEVCTNQGFISIIPNQNYLRMYILHNLITRKEEILAFAGGTTYKEITKKTFREMKVLIPKKQLLQRFNEFTLDIFEQMRILKKQNVIMKIARNILLTKLMGGDIKV